MTVGKPINQQGKGKGKGNNNVSVVRRVFFRGNDDEFGKELGKGISKVVARSHGRTLPYFRIKKGRND